MAAKRKAIRAAIVSQLANITTGNGYSVNIGDIDDEHKSSTDVSVFPAVQVIFGREVKGAAEMHRREGVIEFLLFCQASGDTADDTLDDLSGDIGDNLEVQTGAQWLSLGYVYDVELVSVDPIEVDEATHRDVRVWVVSILVRYRHDRGDS